MYHTFNIEVAKKVGVNAAIILNNIYWWIEKNKANNKHFYDGYYWTYNARKAYVELFPYFTERQIEYALKNLIDNGYVITGNYNKSAYDRTLWYAITKKGYSILQNCEMEVTKTVNENNKNVKPIPDINTNINDNRYKHNPISNDIGGKAEKKSYKDIFEEDKYKNIKEALVLFVKTMKERNYTPRVTTVNEWADKLLDYGRNNPNLAMRVVKQSIDKNWKSIYPLKSEAVSVKWDPELNPLATDENGDPVVF